MCGIAGYYNLDGQHPPPLDVMVTWVLLASRGFDAAGALWRGSVHLPLGFFKSAGRSYDFATRIWPAIVDDTAGPLRWVALHARAATHGPPSDAANNHPVNYGKVWVTHNGVVTNDDAVFKLLGVERAAKVDTEAIAACLHVGGIEKVLELCEGCFAIAWASEESPDVLHLYTNGGSSLWVTIKEGCCLTYASTSTLVPIPLHGATCGELRAGVHLTIGADGVIHQANVGVGRFKPVVNFAFPSALYRCYSTLCHKAGTDHWHGQPSYSYSLHTKHGILKERAAHDSNRQNSASY